MSLLFRFCILTAICAFVCCAAAAQDCHTGKLDPAVTNLLKAVPADNRSLEDLIKSKAYLEFRKEGLPEQPYPQQEVQRIKVTSDSIPLYIYNPLHPKNLPIIIHCHGGGFFNPVQKWMEPIFWNSAITFSAIVLVVDYRVAPGYKFPAGLNDCYKAFKWIVHHGTELGGDTSKIIIKGESSGANLVAGVCQKALQDGLCRYIKLQVMNCPVTDNTNHASHYKSMQENADRYLMSTAAMVYELRIYANETDYNNPLLAPILSTQLKGLPPAVILTAEFDPLRDQGSAYAGKLKEAGVEVFYRCFPGQIHCMIGSEQMTKEANLFVLNAIKSLVK